MRARRTGGGRRLGPVPGGDEGVRQLVQGLVPRGAEFLTFPLEPRVERVGARRGGALQERTPVGVGGLAPVPLGGGWAEGGGAGRGEPADARRFGLDVLAPRAAPQRVQQLAEAGSRALGDGV